MDFITGFPMTWRQHDSIMVVVDKLTKATPFILVKYTHKTAGIAKISMKEFFRLHGFRKAIVSNRDSKFTSNFWKGLFADLGMKLNSSTAYLSCPSLEGTLKVLNFPSFQGLNI